VFEEALKSWLEKQKSLLTTPLSAGGQTTTTATTAAAAADAATTTHDVLSSVENDILMDFVDVTESLIRGLDNFPSLPSFINIKWPK